VCHVITDSASLSTAAFIEPLAVATHAIKGCGITSYASKSVLVLGGGPIGLAVIIVLRTKGARAIYVSEPTKERQEQDRVVADLVIDPRSEKIGERCRMLTDGKGVDVVFGMSFLLVWDCFEEGDFVEEM